MKTILAVIPACMLPFLCLSQSGPDMFAGAGYQGNGQIGLLTKDAEAAIVLPALLATRSTGGWSLSAATRPGVNDLTEISGALHVLLPWDDHIAAGVQYTGIKEYAEQRFTFSYARRLFEKLNLALQFELNRNQAEEYDDVIATTWSISFQAPLANTLSMSAWLYNPLGNEGALDLPSMARIGVLYEPSKKVSVAMEAEKSWSHPLRIKAGMLYQLHPRIAVRWGISTYPALVHAGITWNLFNKMAITSGWRYHSQIGSSLSAALSKYYEP
jgi:hypothetical protein